MVVYSYRPVASTYLAGLCRILFSLRHVSAVNPLVVVRPVVVDGFVRVGFDVLAVVALPLMNTVHRIVVPAAVSVGVGGGDHAVSLVDGDGLSTR